VKVKLIWMPVTMKLFGVDGTAPIKRQLSRKTGGEFAAPEGHVDEAARLRAVPHRTHRVVLDCARRHRPGSPRKRKARGSLRSRPNGRSNRAPTAIREKDEGPVRRRAR
jgi:hypothetical protein